MRILRFLTILCAASFALSLSALQLTPGDLAPADGPFLLHAAAPASGPAPTPAPKPAQAAAPGPATSTPSQTVAAETPATAPAPPDLGNNKSIFISTIRIELRDGARVLRIVPTPAAAPLDFGALVRAVGDPAWVSETQPGVFMVSAAIVQAPGTSLRVAAPSVREVRLAALPGVHLGGSMAKATFEGVTVTSWDPQSAGPVVPVQAGRPYVLYRNHSELVIKGSQFGYLGSNASPATGVTWWQSGGSATASVFFHNYVGALGGEATSLLFDQDVFRDNTDDGVRLQGSSSGGGVQNSDIGPNGHSGVVVSSASSRVLVWNDRVHDNADGVVVRLGASRTVVAHNNVEGNTSHALTVFDSSDIQVSGNMFSGSRNGVAIDGKTANVSLDSNTVSGARLAVSVGAASVGTSLVDTVVRGPSHGGIRIGGPHSVISGGTINDAEVGLDVRVDATVRNLAIRGARRGVLVRGGATLTIQSSRVFADHVGIAMDSSSRTLLEGSKVWGRVAAEGGKLTELQGSKLSTPPVSRLTIFGGGILLIAILLETLRALLERRDPPIAAPPAMWNVT
jgi:hypothetical protein